MFREVMITLELIVISMQVNAREDAYDKDICEKVKFVNRQAWHARPPVRTFPMVMPVGHVIILETVKGACRTSAQCIRNIQFIQDYHLDDKGWWDIAYSFLIGGDGRVYVGVGWTDCAEHSINYNTISIGLAFIGNFTLVRPSEAMVQAALDLVSCGVFKGYLTPTVQVHGHRDVTCSQDPGEALYNIIRTWKNYIGGRLSMYHCGSL